MCAGCVTSFESVVFQGAGVVAMVTQARRHLGRSRVPAAVRRRQSDERAAALLREVGLDPAEYLVPAGATATATATTATAPTATPTACAGL